VLIFALPDCGPENVKIAVLAVSGPFAVGATWFPDPS
jgi:hypothetical protein